MRSTQAAWDVPGWPVISVLTRSVRRGRSSAPGKRPSLLRWLGAATLAAAVLAWPAPLAASTGARSLAGDTLCGSDGFTANATPGDGQVTVSWCALVNADASYSYNVFDGTSPEIDSESQVNDSPIQSTSYDVTGLTNGTTYYFSAEAIESVNGKPVSSTSSAVVPATPAPATSAPGAPTGLMAYPGDSLARLSWTAPAADGGTPITGYHVYGGTSPNGEAQAPVANVPGTSATVSGLSDGTQYYFLVTAVNADGDGPSSNEAWAVPMASPPRRSPPVKSPPVKSPPVRSPPVHSPPVLHRQGNHSGSTSPPAWWLVILLSFAGVIVAAVALVVRSGRRRGPSAPAREPNVRVEPNAGPPGKVAVHSTGSRPTISVRVEPHPGARTTTIKETRR